MKITATIKPMMADKITTRFLLGLKGFSVTFAKFVIVTGENFAVSNDSELIKRI